MWSLGERVTWIAGPTQYYRGNYAAFDMAWDFVGGDSAGKIKRWRLRYRANKRTFVVTVLKADLGDQYNSAVLTWMYLPSAVRRTDLPPGGIVEALKAMLPDSEIAIATAMALAPYEHRHSIPIPAKKG